MWSQKKSDLEDLSLQKASLIRVGSELRGGSNSASHGKQIGLQMGGVKRKGNPQTEKKTRAFPPDLKEMFQPRAERPVACEDRKGLRDRRPSPYRRLSTSPPQTEMPHSPTCRAMESPMADHSE